VVRCGIAGQLYLRCVYIWVDTDFALARGLYQGYPKKLGSIRQTRPHPFGRAAPRIAPGGRFAGTLAAADRRLAQAVVTLREECAANGFVNAHPMAHHRWMPSIEKGAPDSLNELIRSGSASFEAGPAWRGDADLELFDSPTEELARLEVNEMIGGYYRQVGVTWDGGTLLAEGGTFTRIRRPTQGPVAWDPSLATTPTTSCPGTDCRTTLRREISYGSDSFQRSAAAVGTGEISAGLRLALKLRTARPRPPDHISNPASMVCCHHQGLSSPAFSAAWKNGAIAKARAEAAGRTRRNWM
jgi:hypothetical protein